MSVAYYIVLDDEDPGFDPFVNGKAVARAMDELDALCRRSGLTKLSDFLGQSLDDFSDLIDEDLELPEGENGSDLWFDPEDGLTLLDELLDKIRAEPRTVSHPDEVIEDLVEYREVLRQAKEVGACWHLALDI